MSSSIANALTPRLRPRLVLSLPMLITALGVLACAGDGPTGPPDPPAVASIQVTPGGDTLIAIGRTRTFTAVARAANGTAIPDATIRWRSSDTLVARVDSMTGVVTAVSNGGATITALAGGVTGTGTVAVIQFVAAVQLTPGTVGLATIGATQPYTAVARDSANAVVNGVRFLWISSNPSVATIDTNGVAVAVGPGTTTISASGRGVPAYSTLTVTQAATHLAFVVEPADTRAGDAFAIALQVEVRDAGGAPVRDSRIPVTLSLAPPVPGASLFGSRTVNAVGGVATFSNVWIDHTGALNTLIATSGALAPDTSATFTVRPGPPVTATMTSNFLNARVGDVSTGSAQVVYRDALGNQADVTPPTRIVARSPLGDSLAMRVLGVFTGVGTANFGNIALDQPIAGARLESIGQVGGVEIRATSAQFSVRVELNSLALGTSHACGLSVGGIVCWGADFANQLDNSTGADSIPTLTNEPWNYLQVAAGGNRNCALTEGGAVDCWGTSFRFRVPGTGFGGIVLSRITVGTSMSCGLTANGTAYCWGTGPLGDGPTSTSATPVQVQGTGPGGLVVTDISSGAFYNCLVTTLQEAYCWGSNGAGQLGDSTQVDRTLPTLVLGSGAGSPAGDRAFVSIQTGPGETTCGINVNANVLCWGRAPTGNGTGTGSRTPQIVAPLSGATFIDVDVGDVHACAVTTAGGMYCWGYNTHGAVGPDALNQQFEPMPMSIPGRTILDVEVGPDRTCARTDNGVYCWGANPFGQLGIGTTEPGIVRQPARIRQ